MLFLTRSLNLMAVSVSIIVLYLFFYTKFNSLFPLYLDLGLEIEKEDTGIICLPLYITTSIMTICLSLSLYRFHLKF